MYRKTSKMKNLKPRALIVAPFNPDLRVEMDVRDEKELLERDGYIPLIMHEVVKSGEEIGLDDLVDVLPFLIKEVDLVVMFWNTETELYEVACDICRETKTEIHLK